MYSIVESTFKVGCGNTSNFYRIKEMLYQWRGLVGYRLAQIRNHMKGKYMSSHEIHVDPRRGRGFPFSLCKCLTLFNIPICKLNIFI